MRLYEHEGKSLLGQYGLSIPSSVLTSVNDGSLFQFFPVVAKAQVLFGNRAEKKLIQIIPSQDQAQLQFDTLKQSLASLLPRSETIKILWEPLVPFSEEWYLSIRYDTQTRLPVVWFTTKGGTGIETRLTAQDFQILPLEKLAQTPLPVLQPEIPNDWLKTIVHAFFAEDMTLLEINPLVIANGRPLILDAKIELDDSAHFRHPEWTDLYPPRTLFTREPTLAEQQAKQINALDHRGVAGASYFDFDGSVAVIGSGGGASILAMDTLLTTTLQPANYTEYSGNPSREKVAALTKLVLQKPNLQGLWVVGGHANFTDQYETLMGIFDGLENSQLPQNFPVVIRRGGPRLEEAFAALKQRAASLSIQLRLFSSETPIPESAFALEKLVQNSADSGEKL